MQTPLSLATIADRIDTGLDDPETSRALIVFNQSAVPLGGVAVFRASMSLLRDTPLPPVAVTDSTGETVPAAVTNFTEGPDAKGRSDRRQLTFSLCFAVFDVPAHGWRTYLASYAEAASPPLLDFVETLGLTVVETTRHDGDLPPRGNF
jgi:hypothetical protein